MGIIFVYSQVVLMALNYLCCKFGLSLSFFFKAQILFSFYTWIITLY